MGLFAWLTRSKQRDPIADEMRRLAPTLFPGGHDEIIQRGREISGFLDHRIPPEAASKLYASTIHLMFSAKDKSKSRITAYIERTGMGRISADDAAAIYDRFIAPRAKSAPSPAPTRARPSSVLVHILDPIEGYKTERRTPGVDIDPSTVTRLAQDDEMFMVTAYEQGKPKSAFCSKAHWLALKAQMDGIEQSGQNSRHNPIVVERPHNLDAMRAEVRKRLGARAPAQDEVIDGMIAEMLKLSLIEGMFGPEGDEWDLGGREYENGGRLQSQEIRFRDGRPSAILYFDFSEFSGS